MRTHPQPSEQRSNQPSHEVKLKRTDGEKAQFEKIGAAWRRDNGTLYVKLSGTQIISEGFYMFETDNAR